MEIRGVYEGRLKCSMIHGPSGQEIRTDAPTDNFGEGSLFSPTDLVAAALGSCMLTVMGLVAHRHQLDLAGTAVRVLKEMRAEPLRTIGRLAVTITFPRRFSEAERQLLERAAMSCPVHRSLRPDVDAPVEFRYPA